MQVWNQSGPQLEGFDALMEEHSQAIGRLASSCPGLVDQSRFGQEPLLTEIIQDNLVWLNLAILLGLGLNGILLWQGQWHLVTRLASQRRLLGCARHNNHVFRPETIVSGLYQSKGSFCRSAASDFLTEAVRNSIKKSCATCPMFDRIKKYPDS